MADQLTREKISYNSNPFSPVPTYWTGTSYEKVQGINGATRIIAYDSSGETFTDASPGSVTIVSSAGGTTLLNSTNPSIIKIVSSAGGTTLMSNSNPANIQIVSSASGSIVLTNNSPGFMEIVSSAGGTSYFSSTNQGYLTHKYSENEANAWSSNATISSGATSRVINAIYNEQVNYFGTITNTATITLSMQVSQNNFSWYTAETKTFTAGTSSPFFYSFATSARYLRLTSSGVSATITASIMGKYKWYTNIVQNGNFANSTTLWSNITTTALTVINNIVRYTATAQFGRIQQTSSNYLDMRGHKCYASANIKTDTTQNILYINDGVDQTGVSHTGDSQFHRLSVIRTISTASVTLLVKLQDARTSGWTETQATNFLLIDLTNYFGAGNEPSLTICDKIFPFIE